NKIPIRIGVNAGSLEKEFLDKFGKPCSDAMIESAKRHVKILEDLDFYDIAISLKASNLDMCIEAYEKAADTFNYPLHLGITEARNCIFRYYKIKYRTRNTFKRRNRRYHKSFSFR
ncbi:MAG: flavodoxin-dependent (E)-4-hydroxy-3-methylbut-2-enyl-diphosphate synthase, partial [Methanobrevibacter sp.]|nr:flavodoxin-dependent (E)-4-hydroxy-3-methylbut-2-enyl-diphosphate synthase [Methanobrevibacter sp.]